MSKTFFAARKISSFSTFLILIKFNFQVANQFYEAEVLSEYIIKGNAAIIKCNIPSFVTDFVRVEAWISSEGDEFTLETEYGEF